jgi:serine/threonine protein kinase
MSDPPTGWQPPLSPGEPRSFGNGRYVVQRRLGAGNFATVYLAHDDRLDVSVAVKLLSDRWSWEPEVRGRFVQEARLLRSLNDARVVQIRDIAETDDGRPYLVMDFATEGTLEQRMLELTQRQVRVAPFHLRVAARAIADALGVLHERRIAHRDIKPSNMLITRAAPSVKALDPSRTSGPPVEDAVLRPGERLMLGDLGLAKDLAFDSGITVGVGTAGYMAPEQSLAGGKIDMRTDIFAATALLAQIASGEAPDPVRRVSSGRIETGRPLPASIPPVLGAALLRGLDADPDRRPQTIEAWLADVDAALIAVETNRPFAPPIAVTATVAPSAAIAPPPTAAPPVSVPSPSPASRDPASTRRFAIVGAAVLVVAGAIGIGIAVSGDDDPRSTDGSVETTDEVDPATDLSVDITGPTEIQAGESARWEVESEGVVEGTWSLTGPVAANPDDWVPHNGFEGTWNYAVDDIVLTLVARDEDGNTVRDSIRFDVVDG